MRSQIKILILICFFLALSSSVARCEDMPGSCRKFTQEFYGWYVPLILNDKRGVEAASSWAIKLRPTSFSRELLNALTEDMKEQRKAPGEIVGIDFDPFLNSQDPASEYAVGKVSVKNGKCFADTHSVDSGKRSLNAEVVTELQFKQGKWSFTNFHYAKKTNLLGILKGLKAERTKARI